MIDRLSTTPISVIVGPDIHGVVRHARTVADAASVGVARFQDVPTAEELATLPTDATVAHLHYTDRIFGPDAETAAARLREVVDRLERRVLITMHDVPEDDGSAHSSRRVGSYRHVAGCADVVVVASNHERDRLRRCGIDAEVHVIPLPIDDRAGDRATCQRAASSRRTVGILGFIYPGKGHDDVIDASALLPSDVVVVAMGEPSAGHFDMAAALQRLAEQRGGRFAITGSLDDAALDRALHHVDVPVVPARSTSASASLGAWIGAGRRPVVAANGYTREIASTAPDLLTLYDPRRRDDLVGALNRALTEPQSTWRSMPVPEVYSLAAIGRNHRDLYHHVATGP